MESLLYSQSFFLISSFCLIFITILLVIALVYIINIVKVVYDVTKIIKKKVLQVSFKLDDIEEQLADSKLAALLSLLFVKKKKTKK